MAALYVQWPVRFGEAEDQATRPVFVMRIVFYDCAASKCFPDLRDAYVTQYALVGCVLRELEEPFSNLLA